MTADVQGLILIENTEQLADYITHNNFI